MRFIQSGCAIDRNRFALLCLDNEPKEEDPDHDILFVEVQHRPTIVKRKGENIRLSRVSRNAEEIAVLSREGALEIFSFDGASLGHEDITGSIAAGTSPPKFGFLMSLRLIGDALYACGMGGQVYARTAPGLWQLISEEICTTNAYDRWFSNIDGLRPDYILADGLSGLLYTFDGAKWRRIETGTSAAIGEMAFVGEDKVYIAGAQSTLLNGNPSVGFRKVIILQHDLTFYAVCRFQDRIWLGTERGVMEMSALGQLSNAMVDVDANAFDVVSLQSVDDVMWCFGSTSVYRYDGARWDSILRL